MATQASLNFVQELYVAYYGRPADSQGLEYWAERADQEGQGAILNAFGTSQEFTEEYGSLDGEALVNSLYQQLFSRDAEQEGLNYYSEVLASGEKSLSEIAVTIMNAAQGSDQEVIDAKVEVADYYTETVDDSAYDYELAQSLIADIDGETAPQEIEEIKAEIDSSVGDGGETPPPADSGDGSDGGETPPVDGGDGEPSEPSIPEEQILAAQTDITSYAAADLEGYQAIRFSGFGNQTINLYGLGDKTLLVEDSTGLALNLNQMATGQLDLAGSSVTLYAETENGEPTGSLTSLDVTARSDSSLDFGSSAAAGLAQLNVSGEGNLALTGDSLGSLENAENVSLDAAALSGDLTVAEGVLEDATNVTAGSGNDTINMQDISAGGTGSAPVIDGGAGDDTLNVSGSMTTDQENGAVDTSVSDFETVSFDKYVEIDAGAFSGTEEFIFASGGSINSQEADQSVTATAGGLGNNGTPLIVRDAQGDVDVNANFSAAGESDALEFIAISSVDALDGGTLNLSGSGRVNYSDGGKAFDAIDASNLEGGLTFTSADYVSETVTLGSGADTLNIADGSIFGRLDSIVNFDAESDSLDIEEELIDFSGVEFDEGTTSLEDAFDEMAGASTDGSYVAFEHGGNTYLYADTEVAATDDAGVETDETGVSYSDFVIELTGVTGLTADDLAMG